VSFDQEWAQLKKEGQADASPAMRLAGYSAEDHPDRAGARADLAVHQDDLGAVGNAAYDLYQDMERVSGHARKSTVSAAGSLPESLELGSALKHVAKRWTKQCRSIQDACAHISNHLDYSMSAHHKDEAYISGTVSKISTLDKGFDERGRPHGS
jgi:hypothetical protein